MSRDAPGIGPMEPPRVAVIGAGVSGAACAAELLRIGLDVTVFDKSRDVGGRMATRQVQWTCADGTPGQAAFDHGCPHFSATLPRFRAVIDRALAGGHASAFRQRVHASFPAGGLREVIVPTPNMPSFCRALLGGVPLRLGHAVSALQREAGGWMLHRTDEPVEGPFDHVVLALPSEQAALLLRGRQSDWAERLAAARTSPCWTLMAVTDEVEWPWDAAWIEAGELGWIARQDRLPGRACTGGVPWIAHATPSWSAAHLEDDPAQVTETLRAALGRLLGGPSPRHWHHASVHRWRYARRVQAASGKNDHWWSTRLGLGVCGDAFAGGSVEAAWCSGDSLARSLMASLDASPGEAAAMQPAGNELPSAFRRRRLSSFLPISTTPTGDSPWVPLDAYF